MSPLCRCEGALPEAISCDKEIASLEEHSLARCPDALSGMT